MSRIRFDCVVFDLDGTLADTAPDLTAALNHALSALGRPEVPAESVRHMVGHGARALLAKGLAASGEAPPELIDAGFPIFLDHYEANIAAGTYPYPGVEQALDALAADGVRLAICTNKLESLARQLVDALGWTGRFRAVIGGDTLTQRKPDPAPILAAVMRAGGTEPVFVGDSISDTEGARNAGMPCVALSFGFSDRPATELGADAVIDHWDELIPALIRL